MSRVHRLALTLTFPAGVAAGDGGEFNRQIVARNGQQHPVLRGSALAGALRNAWRKHVVRSNKADAIDGRFVEAQVERFFGRALGDDEVEVGQESALIVPDSPLDVGSQLVHLRTHHLRNRHNGVVADGGLFSLETCPPGTTAQVVLWLRDEEQAGTASAEFLATLVGLLDGGMTLGGNSARGVGLACLSAEPAYRVFDLSNVGDHAAYLDEYREWRERRRQPSQRASLPSTAAAADEMLKVEFTLAIPRGQDLLVGDGQGVDFEIKPQRVLGADGRTLWRLPGSSLRGLFRGWMTRLAAREGRQVADNAKLQAQPRSDNHLKYNGDNLGWCFLHPADRQVGFAATECPIASLFGTLFQAGRIHVADSFAVCSTAKEGRHEEEQERMHVAVDRITGGAAESMLFSNTVLTARVDGKSPQFPVTIVIRDAHPDETRWLAKTLRALHVGVLRVGSSKASGRLELAGHPRVQGKLSEEFLAAWNKRQKVTT